MPPRYSYWTIIAGGLPTAFRAAEREELLPTFTRLREKHPDAEMKWFARGKLWDTPDAARRDTEERRGGSPRGEDRDRPARSAGPRDRDRRGEGDGGAARGRDWRPGGEHRDPRQPYIDAKKARNLDRRKEKFERKHGAGEEGAGARPPKPQWAKPREERFRDRPRDESDRPRRDAGSAPPVGAWEKPRGTRPAAPKGGWGGDRERGPRAESPAGRGDRPRDRQPRSDEGRDRFRDDARPAKPQWSKPRGPGAPKGNWSGDRDRGPRPAAPKGNWGGDRERGRSAESPPGRSDRPRERDTRDRAPRERFRDDSRPAKPQWSKPRGPAAPKGNWGTDRERPRERDTRDRAPSDRFRDDARPAKPQWSKPRGAPAPKGNWGTDRE